MEIDKIKANLVMHFVDDVITVGKMRLYPATSIIKRHFLQLVKQICSCNIRSGFIYVSNPTSKDKSILLPLPSHQQNNLFRIKRVKLSPNTFGKVLVDCKAKDLNIVADQGLNIPDIAYKEYYHQENTRFYNVSYIGSLYYNKNCRRGDLTKRLINIDWRFCKPNVVKVNFLYYCIRHSSNLGYFIMYG